MYICILCMHCSHVLIRGGREGILSADSGFQEAACQVPVEEEETQRTRARQGENQCSP